MFKQLLGGKCLVKMNEPPEKVGRIIIPDAHRLALGYQGEAKSGTVVQLGTGERKEDGTREPFEFSVGDKVFIGCWAGTDYQFDGEAYKVVLTKDVIALDER